MIAALPDTLPDEAVTVELPAATPAARPELLIVATDAVEELHVAWAVISAVVVSEYMPNALNCCVLPALILTAPGTTISDASVADEAGVAFDVALARIIIF